MMVSFHTSLSRLLAGKLGRWVVGICVCGCSCMLTLPVLSDELPSDILSGLKDESFEAREKAQLALLEWGKKGDEEAKVQLYELSQTSDHPEVRRRCMATLRLLLYDYYENTGPGFVGIMMQDAKVTSEVLPDIANAVTVTRVLAGHGAEAAGIKVKDEIYGMKGHKAPNGVTMDEFRAVIGVLKPKEKVTLLLLRDGEAKEIEVVIGRRPVQVFDQRFGGRQSEEQLEEKAKEEFFEQWLEKKKADN